MASSVQALKQTLRERAKWCEEHGLKVNTFAEALAYIEELEDKVDSARKS